MEIDPAELLVPKILVLDDERQIHLSLRLRLYKTFDLTFCFNASDALQQVSKTEFDLCFVDLHMPGMNGLEFITEARTLDPLLGLVILSAFDSAENLRRTIPLQVFDFVGKPFPERHEFESRIPDWITRTRKQRRDHRLANTAGSIERALTTAVTERETELVASETARDALNQISNILTTIQAHLVVGAASATPKLRVDPSASALLRNVDAARKAVDTAATLADRFFSSAYASRNTSPAIIHTGLTQAIQIAVRNTGAEAANKIVDYTSINEHLSVTNLSGIEFLLMVVPALTTALHLASPNTTVELKAETVDRIDETYKLPGLSNGFWVNRKQALLSRSGVIVKISAAAPALSRGDFECWIKNDEGSLTPISSSGMIAGIQKCKGLIGMGFPPAAERFLLALALPV